MTAVSTDINGIPALIWGPPSAKAYLFVHGKMSCKEAAEEFAEMAGRKGWQTVSFDLAQHGQRQGEARRCDVWNGMEDLTAVARYVFDRWKEVALYACSLGAYFSLNAYGGRRFSKCLFQSPILDMEYLVRQMMVWFDISEQRLAEEKEIDTPIDLLRWDYFQYVLAQPVTIWSSPTCILYGAKDDLQSLDVIRRFADRFGCEVTVAENSEHSFMSQEDGPIVRQWLLEHI